MEAAGELAQLLERDGDLVTRALERLVCRGRIGVEVGQREPQRQRERDQTLLRRRGGSARGFRATSPAVTIRARDAASSSSRFGRAARNLVLEKEAAPVGRLYGSVA